MPFPITCAACHKTFSIADDVFERKVKGRIVTINCKQCQSGIRVDGTKDKPVFSVSDSVRPPPVAAADAPAAGPTVVAAKANAGVSAHVAAPVAAKAPSPAASTKAAQTATLATAPIAAKAALAANEAVPGAQRAAPAVAATAKASATLSAAKVAPTGTAPKNPAGVLAPKAAPATSSAKPAGVAGAPRVQPAVALKAAPRTPFANAAGGVKPVAITPKAPAVAPTAKAPAPIAKAEPAPVGQAEPGASAAEVEARPAAKAAPEIAAAPTPAAAEPAAPVENLWAVDYPDGEDRELTLREIEKELTAGRINLSTLVWREGMAEWLELGQLPELSALLAAAAPTATAEPSSPPAQRVQAASAPVVEAGLSVTLPQPTLPLPAQRPPAPSVPVIDFAERDALRAAPPPPVPKLSPTFSTRHDSRPPTPPVFVPDAGSVPANPVPAFPSAPGMAASFAAPVPARANPSGVAPIANVEDWPQKSRAPWIIGGLALLAVGGLVFFLNRPSADELPPPVAISALPPSVPSTPPHVPDPEPTAASDSAAAAQPSAGSNPAMQPPGSAPVASPNAGFAELFANGARNADEKGGASGPGQRFDPVAAKAALAATANQTADCREKGGPTGNATVVVTFDPTGKVASATVSDPPFAGTSSGACIAATLKRATVHAFSGLPGTVTKVISIQ